jgi:ribosomal protein S18 acetylase RimI-like enzyme
MLDGTQDLEVARSWAAQLLKDKNPAKYYISPLNFVAAFKNESAFSFVVTGEPFYGHLYGSGAYLDPRCNDIAIASEELFSPAGFIVRGGGFQFWEARTEPNGAVIEILNDADEINDLIDQDAPDSSVRPGDPEEIFWGGIRNPQGRLACAAVVVQWQSGFHVLASVVTRANERGNGYATQLVRGISSHADSMGIEMLGLGVRPTNIAAQRAYEKAGFSRIGSFTNYSRE